jgi:membrane-bound lytic murein transglycosylase D
VALFIAHQDSIYAQSQDSLSRRPVTVEPDKSVRSKKSKKSSKGSDGASYHTVKKGETLFSIANKYGISVEKLKKLNGIKRDRINKGQRLKVR